MGKVPEGRMRLPDARPKKETHMIESIISLLRCPLCGGAFLRADNSLVCEKRHTYDIARQGYVNFVPGQKEMFYKKELFVHRAEALRAGVYAPVVERLDASDDAVRILEDIIPIEQPYFSDYF